MTTPLAPTPGQTVGPFFGYALPFAGGPDLVSPGSVGAIRLHGLVLDGAGLPVPDALVEIWQCDDRGRPARRPGSLARTGHDFTGFGRAATDNAGRYSFTTVRPGADDSSAGAGVAPFWALTVFARGLLDRLFTRVYVPGHDAAWPADPLLASLPDHRRRTLIGLAEGTDVRFDIRLQGADETVFLSYGRSGA